MQNPFYVTGTIPEAYFCDREAETHKMVTILENQGNILLSSPRRMGKTQLIRHVYEQPGMKDRYYTFYVDIFPTTSLHELVLFLSKEIYSVLVPKGKSALDFFLSAIKSLAGSFGYDPLTGSPTFDIKMGNIHSPELTLKEIFDYLEQADRPCIFAIDEFQQIASYPQKNVEALLRSYIQPLNNCHFIYSGSNRHLLENMFLSSAQPFNNSAEQMHLGTIPKDKYLGFIQRCFKEAGREILPDAAALAYDLFEGHTYYVHNLMHNTFAYADTGKVVTTEDVKEVLKDMLQDRTPSFFDRMNQLNYQQKETLVAIAREGRASAVTSVAFVKRHALQSPSSVQYALKQLLDKGFLTFETDGKRKLYSVEDRFFALWIQQVY